MAVEYVFDQTHDLYVTKKFLLSVDKVQNIYYKFVAVVYLIGTSNSLILLTSLISTRCSQLLSCPTCPSPVVQRK